MAARGLVNGRGPLRRSGRDLVLKFHYNKITYGFSASAPASSVPPQDAAAT